MFELYHTNHQFYDQYKCDKFLLKFESVRNPLDLLAVLMPASVVDRIHITDKNLMVKNRLEGSVIVLCSEILVKAKV
mgnify:CR=1 FL=1